MFLKEYTTGEYWNKVWNRPYARYETHHQVFWGEIRKLAKGSIIDLGCGSASCWKGTDFKITGVDFSDSALKEAERNVKDSTFIHSKIEDLSINEKFDTIVICGVVNYYRDLNKISNIIRGLSKENSLIIITINVIDDFPDRHWDSNLIREVFGNLGKEISIDYFDKIGYLIKISV